LAGLGGADTFAFFGGDVTIADFTAADGDKIDVSGFNGTGFTEAEIQALIDAAAPDSNTIAFDSGSTLTLTDVNVHALNVATAFILS
jgi:hypothetical protein